MPQPAAFEQPRFDNMAYQVTELELCWSSIAHRAIGTSKEPPLLILSPGCLLHTQVMRMQVNTEIPQFEDYEGPLPSMHRIVIEVLSLLPIPSLSRSHPH